MFALAVTCVAALAAGCAGPAGNQLTLQSVAHRDRAFTQSFAAAYVARDSSGQTSVVLADQATQGALDGTPRHAPVRQVMTIRLLWNAKRDMIGEHSSASNATIHWYVMGNTSESAADVIEYAGTGYVSLEAADGQSEVTVHRASLSPVACRGGLHDPIGPAVLRGTVHAIDDHQRARQILAGVRTAIAAADALADKAAVRTVKPESPSSLAR